MFLVDETVEVGGLRGWGKPLTTPHGGAFGGSAAGAQACAAQLRELLAKYGIIEAESINEASLDTGPGREAIRKSLK